MILIESDVASSRSVEYLERDLCGMLSAHVELHHTMHTLQNLPLDDSLAWEARVEKHRVGPQALLIECSLHPVDEILVNILHHKNLNIRDVVTVAPRNVELIHCRVLAATSIRARTSVSICVLSSVAVG